MREEPTVRGILRAAVTLTVVVLLAGCGSVGQKDAAADQTAVDQAAADHTGPDHAHDHAGAVHVDVTDPLPDASLGELSRASELVVSGRVASVTDGVQIGTDPDTGYAVVTITVAESLKGSPVGPTVDVAMLSHLSGTAVVIAGRPTPELGDRGVWMLRAIAAEFGRDGYVLTNQSSQILVGSDGLTGGVPGSPSAEEIARLGDLAGVLEHLRAQSA